MERTKKEEKKSSYTLADAYAYYDYKLDDETRKILDKTKADVHTVVLYHAPYTMAQQMARNELMQNEGNALLKKYLYSSRYKIEQRIQKWYEKWEEVVNHEIEEIVPSSICLCFDGWKSNGYDYLGVIVRYLVGKEIPTHEGAKSGKEVVIKQRLVALDYSPTASHDTQGLSDQLQTIVKKYPALHTKYSEVLYMVCDNVSVNQAVVKLQKKNRIPCVAHLLQLSLKDLFERKKNLAVKSVQKFQDIIKIVNEYNTFFSRSSVAAKELENEAINARRARSSPSTIITSTTTESSSTSEPTTSSVSESSATTEVVEEGEEEEPYQLCQPLPESMMAMVDDENDEDDMDGEIENANRTDMDGEIENANRTEAVKTKAISLKPYCETRWSSLYDSIIRLLEFKEFVNAVLSVRREDDKNALGDLTTDTCTLLFQLAAFIRPIYILTKQQQYKDFGLGDSLSRIYEIYRKYDDNETWYGKEIINALSKKGITFNYKPFQINDIASNDISRTGERPFLPNKFLKEAKAKLLFNFEKRYSLDRASYFSFTRVYNKALYDVFADKYEKKEVKFQNIDLFQRLTPLLHLANLTSFDSRAKISSWVEHQEEEAYNINNKLGIIRSECRDVFFKDYPFAESSMLWYANCHKELVDQVEMRWDFILPFLKNNKETFQPLFREVNAQQRSTKSNHGNAKLSFSLPRHLQKKAVDLTENIVERSQSSNRNQGSASNNRESTGGGEDENRNVKKNFLKRIKKSFDECCQITKTLSVDDAISLEFIEDDNDNELIDDFRTGAKFFIEVKVCPIYGGRSGINKIFNSECIAKYEAESSLRKTEPYNILNKTEIYNKSVAFWSDVYYKTDHKELALILMMIHSIPPTSVDVERSFKTAKQVERKSGPLGPEKKAVETILCENFHNQYVPDKIWETASKKNISLKHLKQINKI